MSRLLISAAHKSSGKTTVSLGLCAAFTRRGKIVQPFKKGPDYIDPMWLKKAANRPCHNLDFYLMSNEEILATFNRFDTQSDISIIEGNKGFYDGLDLDGSNSNAALAHLLKAPVILVIDARGMTRGVAPLIRGYQDFDKDININGVILNNLGGSRHESKLRAVIEHYTDVPVLGAVHYDKKLNIVERHLGLIPSNEEQTSDQRINEICHLIEQQVDLDSLDAIAQKTSPDISSVTAQSVQTHAPDIKLGIAMDESFGFYYDGDLEALKNAGAEFVPFNTLKDTHLPDIDALFIGGGFPETHMDSLAANTSLKKEIYDKIEAGLPTYAECGGLMYLSRSISWNGKTADMVGVIPADTVMHEKPQGRGYVRIRETGKGLWDSESESKEYSAHEFHYSGLEKLPINTRYSYKILRGYGVNGRNDGIVHKNMTACYLHLRDVESNHWAERFINFARKIKQERLQ
ncbi:MAG: hydrogenobyrinic acid a,c-diamide synthase (glutamine-hydrolyzing) [Gammaproteobacteria bacterium]|nr:hydrogenobyrinic acid a,c-diamide synthase (glutamine-hydrolyzing) [Gammaproteobacteria bacterium]